MNTNSHGSPIPSESERKQERKRREEMGLANSVRGGGAPARSPVPERTDNDVRWRAAAAVDRECESESEAASESRQRGGGGVGIRDLGLRMEREVAGSGLYMWRGGLASWAASLARPNEAVGAPGRHQAPSLHRAMPVLCHGPGWRPRHDLVPWAVPCPCRAKTPGHGPGRRAAGCMANYNPCSTRARRQPLVPAAVPFLPIPSAPPLASRMGRDGAALHLHILRSMPRRMEEEG